MSRTIRIGTRQSQLALWQAESIKSALLSMHDDLQVELVKIVSAGDKTLDVPLAKIGGKGLFLKELETALIQEDIDLAVHSMKDVTVTLPEGLHISAICKRENPFDAMVSNEYKRLSELPQGARVGTCSLRRQSQVKAAFPHLQLVNLRGNVNTRLSKLDNGEFDAIILAASGLIRLDMQDRISEQISEDICLPAVGQGALGIETRQGDQEIEQLIAPLIDFHSTCCVNAERALNEKLDGGCQVPVAAFATIQDNEIILNGRVGELDGSRVLSAQSSAALENARELGIAVADSLLAQGAGEILQSVYDAANSSTD